jgi:hypothetical protein
MELFVFYFSSALISFTLGLLQSNDYDDDGELECMYGGWICICGQAGKKASKNLREIKMRVALKEK